MCNARAGRGTPERHQEQRVGSADFMPTCFALWKPLPGIKFMFLILVRWLGWEPRNPQLEALSSDHLMNSINMC